ncbi:MAG: transposase [candidate division Zixibacteria bacterium]|nr:transposase [candidate division Zixibacteria bacterium]MBU1470125.1 transposase [candidate division Zixibacteria bacterium]
MFLTNVTLDRKPLLAKHIDLFREAIESTQQRSPFEAIAWVILPDHFHMIVLAERENPSALMCRLKLSYSTRLRGRIGMVSGRIWQYRFWDHIIRDQNDMNRHIDYIHYNPVKHGLVRSPFDWPHSSIHDYLQRGYYAPDWGVREPEYLSGEFGE